MKKFLNISKVFLVLSLVAVVGLVPTTAKASDGIQGFFGDTFFFYYKYGVETFAGSVSQNDSNSVVFNSAEFDQEDYNCLFAYVLEPVGPSDLISPTRMAYGQTYEVRFDVGSKTLVQLSDGSSRVYAFNPNYVIRTRVLCIYHDGSYGYLDFDLDWGQSGYSYTSFILHLSGFEDKYVNQIYIYQWFNFNQAFGNAPLSSVNSMDLSMSVPTVLNETSDKVPSIDIPIIDSPSLDSIPDIGDYLPSDTNPIVYIFGLFYENEHIKLSMILVTVIAITSLVLFGKKR